MSEFQGHFHYDQSMLELDVEYLCSQVRKEAAGFPTVIVGIARGGLVPAVMMSHQLGVKMIALHWSLRDNTRIDEKLLMGLVVANSKVLIVDDICDSGATLNSMYGALKSVYGENILGKIRTAVLWNNTSSAFTPTDWARTIDRQSDKRFIVFPWEV